MTEIKNVLLAEDDETMSMAMLKYLEYAGFNVFHARDGKEAIDLIEKNKNISVIISDIMMPIIDGLNLCRYVRNNKEFDHIPILMMTGNDDSSIRYLGFEVGSDDYLLKPFDLMELLIRIKSLIRRTELLRKSHQTSRKNVLNDGHIIFKQNMTINGKNTNFTPAEIDILKYLYKNNNKIVTSEEILTEVFNHPKSSGNPEIIRTHIKNIRNKIESSRNKPEILIHVPKKGYCFNIDKINIE